MAGESRAANPGGRLTGLHQIHKTLVNSTSFVRLGLEITLPEKTERAMVESSLSRFDGPIRAFTGTAEANPAHKRG